jgi:mRNA-degrading endonuclease RelE of RelBE toxin-antitoxin system
MNSKHETPNFSLTSSQEFERDLQRLDKGARTPVAKKLASIRESGQLPKLEALSGHLKGLHRFRVGNLRILVEVDFVNHTILAIGIEYRADVYKQKR